MFYLNLILHLGTQRLFKLYLVVLLLVSKKHLSGVLESTENKNDDSIL
jgi:hypothetical protein